MLFNIVSLSRALALLAGLLLTGSPLVAQQAASYWYGVFGGASLLDGKDASETDQWDLGLGAVGGMSVERRQGPWMVQLRWGYRYLRPQTIPYEMVELDLDTGEHVVTGEWRYKPVLQVFDIGLQLGVAPSIGERWQLIASMGYGYNILVAKDDNLAQQRRTGETDKPKERLQNYWEVPLLVGVRYRINEITMLQIETGARLGMSEFTSVEDWGFLQTRMREFPLTIGLVTRM